MPIAIEVIKAKHAAEEIDFSIHAIIEAASDLIFIDEIERALESGEIIEDDPARARCIVMAFILAHEPIHLVIDYGDWLRDTAERLVIVTVYRPDPARWIDGRIRRT